MKFGFLNKILGVFFGVRLASLDALTGAEHFHSHQPAASSASCRTPKSAVECSFAFGCGFPAP
jgi:hypothetical protein